MCWTIKRQDKAITFISCFFFQNTRNNFLQIQNNLRNVNHQINAYEKIFNDFKNLDGLQSLTPSSTRRKSPRFVNTGKATTDLLQFSISKAVFPVPKNSDNIHDTDRNKLLPKQSVALLPDPVKLNYFWLNYF